MKRAGINFVLAVFFGAILIYLLNFLSIWDFNVLNENLEDFNVDTQTEFNEFIVEMKETGLILDLINLRNFFTIQVFVLIVFVFSFSTLHLLFDKLFFKKFYESPSLKIAYRRSMLIGSYLILVNTIRIITRLDLFLVFILSFIGIILFIVELSLSRKIKEKND